MSRHVTDWLGGYLDGELSQLRLWRVESHLSQCAACRAELDEFRKLSALLLESPPVEDITAPERFVAQVGLRLPRRPEQPASQRALEVGWRLVPAGLLGAWAFVQTVFIVAGVVQAAGWMGLGGDFAARWLPASQGGLWLSELFSISAAASLSEVAVSMLRLLSNGGPLGWTVTSFLLLLVVIGLLYWSWLASWWVRRQRHQVGVRNNTG